MPRATRLTRALTEDHGRLEEQFRLATKGGVDVARFDVFRRNALLHLAREERVVVPALVAKLGPLFEEVRGKIHLEHESIALLFGPPRKIEHIEELRRVLAHHHALEEQELYPLVDLHLRAEADALLAKAKGLPPVTLLTECEGPQVEAQLQALLRSLGVSRDD